MENKTITFSVEITAEELDQVVAGLENPEKVIAEELVASLCKKNIREIFAKNEKAEASSQIMQTFNDEVKTAEEQVDQKWDGKISVEIK